MFSYCFKFDLATHIWDAMFANYYIDPPKTNALEYIDYFTLAMLDYRREIYLDIDDGGSILGKLMSPAKLDSAIKELIQKALEAKECIKESAGKPKPGIERQIIQEFDEQEAVVEQ
mmetsp:Transcript_41380/g.36740  ORF Transcript_41380/g.36740 Transcript_41380/m.36740 type:complete len:116 (+) Transcript_41380:597-944(+)